MPDPVVEPVVPVPDPYVTATFGALRIRPRPVVRHDDPDPVAGGTLTTQAARLYATSWFPGVRVRAAVDLYGSNALIVERSIIPNKGWDPIGVIDHDDARDGFALLIADGVPVQALTRDRFNDRFRVIVGGTVRPVNDEWHDRVDQIVPQRPASNRRTVRDGVEDLRARVASGMASRIAPHPGAVVHVTTPSRGDHVAGTVVWVHPESGLHLISVGGDGSLAEVMHHLATDVIAEADRLDAAPVVDDESGPDDGAGRMAVVEGALRELAVRTKRIESELVRIDPSSGRGTGPVTGSVESIGPKGTSITLDVVSRALHEEVKADRDRLTTDVAHWRGRYQFLCDLVIEHGYGPLVDRVNDRYDTNRLPDGPTHRNVRTGERALLRRMESGWWHRIIPSGNSGRAWTIEPMTHHAATTDWVPIGAGQEETDDHRAGGRARPEGDPVARP